MNLRELIERLKGGTISESEAEAFLESWGLIDLGLHRIDAHRSRRLALPEVIFGLSKPAEQLATIIEGYRSHDLPFLATRVDDLKAEVLTTRFDGLSYDPSSRLLWSGASRNPTPGTCGIVTAGSSDQPVADEAAGTLSWFGVEVVRVYDSGVAGLHRILSAASRIDPCDVLIVVAGMEGALPSVVGGLFRQPVIAVPTSVGYGASFHGLSALLGMLNSCSAGVTVVNIDNGFGAAAAARSILEMAKRFSDR